MLVDQRHERPENPAAGQYHLYVGSTAGAVNLRSIFSLKPVCGNRVPTRESFCLFFEPPLLLPMIESSIDRPSPAVHLWPDNTRS